MYYILEKVWGSQHRLSEAPINPRGGFSTYAKAYYWKNKLGIDGTIAHHTRVAMVQRRYYERWN